MVAGPAAAAARAIQEVDDPTGYIENVAKPYKAAVEAEAGIAAAERNREATEREQAAAAQAAKRCRSRNLYVLNGAEGMSGMLSQVMGAGLAGASMFRDLFARNGVSEDGKADAAQPPARTRVQPPPE